MNSFLLKSGKYNMSAMWTHYNPVRLFVGAGSSSELKNALQNVQKAIFVTTEGMERRGTAQVLRKSVPEVDWHVYKAAPLPDLDILDSTIDLLRSQAADAQAFVALGGGSVMDTAKALSLALVCTIQNPFDAWLRHGVSRTGMGLPVFCLPSTSGTGAEVTPFATIWDKVFKRKYSIAGSDVFPQAAFVDPSLTYSLPEAETLWGALDALSHALETLWNKTATVVSTSLAIKALELIVQAFPGNLGPMMEKSRRANLQQAALLAGLAISQSHTSLCHAMSYPLTSYFEVPHGLACSAFLKAILKTVDRASGWVTAVDRKLLTDVMDILEKAQIRENLLSYCSKSEILSHMDPMMYVERSGTFSLDVSERMVRNFVDESL